MGRDTYDENYLLQLEVNHYGFFPSGAEDEQISYHQQQGNSPELKNYLNCAMIKVLHKSTKYPKCMLLIENQNYHVKKLKEN